MSESAPYAVSLDMGGGGIRRRYAARASAAARPLALDGSTAAVLFTPDLGAPEGDEYFIPNIHNGLFRIGAHLHDRGFPNEVVYTDLDPMDEVWRRIATHRPAVLGFSTYYNTMRRDIENIAYAAALAPDSLIVVGGFEASLNPQWEALGGLVDVIVYGEGEIPMEHLCAAAAEIRAAGAVGERTAARRRLRDALRARGARGFRVLGVEDGFEPAQRITPEAYREINVSAFTKHLHRSPLAFYWNLTREMYGGRKDAYFRLVTSDHCPWQCTFCQSSVYYAGLLGKRAVPVRFLDPEDVVRVIVEVGAAFPFVSHVYIDDENFLVRRPRALETCERIVEAKTAGRLRRDLGFLCRARSTDITPEVCAALKAADWSMISIGSESYAAAELEFMRKQVTPEQNRRAVRTILGAGLQAAENYILFTPATTEATFREAAEGILESLGAGVDGAATLFITPLPGTPLWGNGRFEPTPRTFPGPTFGRMTHFTNASTGYEYLGETLEAPGGVRLPHPDVLLVGDPLMREVSMGAVDLLPETTRRLAALRPDGASSFSRRFVTLVDLHAAARLLAEKTGGGGWRDLVDEIARAAARPEA